MIELKQVRKIFGSLRAVEGLDLMVPRGEIFGLLGHNGAGKSTAIGMMLGQVWPTAGEILIDGFDITTQRKRALLKVGAIFETPVFYDYLSGWRNLEILSHYTAPTPKARIDEVVEWVGLSGREKSKVRTYSHGMRARLALAQALLPKPELLILDEPSDGLDPEGIHEMRQTILRLHREMGLTILLSSHLLNEVEQLCTRIAVMNKGRKVFEGEMSNLGKSQGWARLEVSDFPAATRCLRAQNLIIDERPNAVCLSEKVAVDQVVRCLVANNIAIHAIAPHEQSLEEFYLELMQSSQPGGKDQPSPQLGNSAKI